MFSTAAKNCNRVLHVLVCCMFVHNPTCPQILPAGCSIYWSRIAGKTLLHNVSGVMRKGQMVALMGLSGSGE